MSKVICNQYKTCKTKCEHGTPHRDIKGCDQVFMGCIPTGQSVKCRTANQDDYTEDRGRK